METLYITHPDCLLHEMQSWHPESPQRLEAINDRLLSSGLHDFLHHAEAPNATEEDLLSCHDADYIASIRDNIPTQGYYLIDSEETSLNPHTWQAALRAAGAGLLAVDEIMAHHYKNAFCAVRPPGHHAEPHKATGFCFFNNMAIAARYAIQQYDLKRIALIDFDVHHGNGTERIFAKDPAIQMYSFFQSPLFPHSGEVSLGKNMHNTAVPAYTRMSRIKEIVEQDWIPGIRQFAPQMIMISAGFDAHREDDMGQLDLLEGDFVWITEQIMQLAETYCDGRIISFLEGGYNLSALARSTVEHIRTLAAL
ncbi:histone deacetylase family protein [Brackiella oedipodis]|uniref:histone deacetylase family protein n=1 Tax=Brackiella oedipodis TaxID=124225 RepID=UPI000491B59A|nr:histone deacetylase family protein [Brackiella oedipodis]